MPLSFIRGFVTCCWPVGAFKRKEKPCILSVCTCMLFETTLHYFLLIWHRYCAAPQSLSRKPQTVCWIALLINIWQMTVYNLASKLALVFPGTLQSLQSHSWRVSRIKLRLISPKSFPVLRVCSLIILSFDTMCSELWQRCLIRINKIKK